MRYVEARIREKQEATREDALAAYAAGPEAFVDLLPGLDARLQTLEGRLAKNSSNSSNPPSADIVKPKGKKRGKGRRKIDAQPGHPASSSRWRRQRPWWSRWRVWCERCGKIHDHPFPANVVKEGFLFRSLFH